MSAFTGTGRLARLVLRRDRIKLGAWLLGTPLLGFALAGSVIEFYPDEAARLSYADTALTSVVARAFNGPIFNADLGSIVVAEAYLTLTLLAALVSTFAVVRHTRQNEETGRAELLGAAVVGRHALLAAPLLVVVGANVAAALLLGLAFAAAGLPLAGSLAAGGAVGGVGVAFTALAAVAAQLTVTSRGANALAAATVGVAFLLRAAGDVLGERDGLQLVSAWPSWLSPLGWGNQVRAFGAERWWVLGLPVVLLVGATLAAFGLARRRDLGAGLLSDRRGPARATAGLLSPSGLLWRLHRGSLVGWSVAVVILGVSMGFAADEVNDVIAENPAAAELIAAMGGGVDDLVDAFLAAMLGVFALVIGAYVVQALLRTRADESGGVLEAVLATAVGRVRWLATQVVGAVLGAAVLVLLAGLATGLGYGLAAGDPGRWALHLGGAGLLQLPALLVVTGLVTALLGLVPRWSVSLSWAVLIGFLLLGQLGAALDLPQAVLNLSPYTHVPAVPAVEVTVLPLVLLTAVAGALLVAGLVGFRRRDVPS